MRSMAGRNMMRRCARCRVMTPMLAATAAGFRQGRTRQRHEKKAGKQAKGTQFHDRLLGSRRANRHAVFHYGTFSQDEVLTQKNFIVWLTRRSWRKASFNKCARIFAAEGSMPVTQGAKGPPAASNSDAQSRLTLALTRAVLENLRPNRFMIPFFALLICAMFSRWVSVDRLAAWCFIVLASLVPTALLTIAFPKGDLKPAQIRRWTILAAAADAVYVNSWASLGWFLWVPDSDFNHLLIQLVLASALAAHANLVGPQPRNLASGLRVLCHHHDAGAVAGAQRDL